IRRFTYDRNNNLLSESVTIQKPGEPERLSETFYTYDVMNRLIMVESAGEFTKYEYDLAGNLVRMITGNGLNVHTYEYDRNGNVIRYIDAEGLEELYVYDLNGNLIEKTDRNGNVIRHVYDDLGRLVETIGRVEPSIEEQEIAMARYEYSRNGLLILEENENITIRHQYDSLGRLIRSTQSDGVVTTHTYDRNNNRLSMRMYLNGELTAYTRYEYDLLDRMVRIFVDGVLEAEYSYDVNGNRSSLSYPLVGVQTTYRFNRANLVTEVVNRVSGEVVSSFEYKKFVCKKQYKVIRSHKL
ncbi:MAG: hypothetical protein FWD82_08070, partial [Defluviitaleaceae bacterium]|nr:hypothetical protein [Defluviitaleaceae bacterium]